MLAIKFYLTMPSDNENVLKGISGNIPAEVICGDETIQPPDKTYTVMSEENYINYLDSISTELDSWKAIQQKEVENAAE